MPKYFFDVASPVLTGDTAHHLINVMRVKPGDNLILCDGACTDFTAVIESVKKYEVVYKILSESSSLTEPRVFITLYQALPKGDKLDLIVQKCVELGVSRIVPVETARCVSKISGTKKMARLQKVAQSAAEQSMRGIIPQVCDLVPFAKAEKSAGAIVAYEKETEVMLNQLPSDAPNLDVWIGPEGGFTQEEITTLVSHGAKTVSLGPRILRTETAAIATVAQVVMLADR